MRISRLRLRTEEAGAHVVILVIGKLVGGEERAEIRITQRIRLIRTQLQHGDNIRRGDIHPLQITPQPLDRPVEHFRSILGRHRTPYRTPRSHVCIRADLIRCPRDVLSGSFRRNLDIHLIEVFWDPEETRREVLGSLNHSILGFGTEYRKSPTFCEIVEQVSV